MAWDSGKTFHLVVLVVLAASIGFILAPADSEFGLLARTVSGPLKAVAWLAEGLVGFLPPVVCVLCLRVPGVRLAVTRASEASERLDIRIDSFALVCRWLVADEAFDFGAQLFAVLFYEASASRLAGSAIVLGLYAALWVLGMARNPERFEARLQWAFARPVAVG